jgi:hypothetical protein
MDTGHGDFLSQIPSLGTRLGNLRRITLFRPHVKRMDISGFYQCNLVTEQTPVRCLREWTFHGSFGLYNNGKRNTSHNYYRQTTLTQKSFPCLTSLRFIDVDDAELLCALLFDISPKITSIEIRPSTYGRWYDYSLASMLSSLVPILQRLQALKSLSLSLPNFIEESRIHCDEGEMSLDKIMHALPNMKCIELLKIAFPLFHCEVVEQRSNDHPAFWSKLKQFVSGCKSLQHFSFGGDAVPDIVKAELPSLFSTRFARAKFKRMPILASRWGPRLYYDNKCICKSALYPYDDTMSEHELEYDDSPESDGESDGELTTDESSYEAPNYWYMDNQSVQYISDADADSDVD